MPNSNKNYKRNTVVGIIVSIAVVVLFKLGANWLASDYCTVREVKTIDNQTPPMSLYAAKACTSTGKCNLDVILLNGQIMSDSGLRISNSLESFVRENPSVKTVCFNSPGGDTVSAKLIGEKIASLGLDTCLAEKYVINDNKFISGTICNSACPWVFLAGTNRFRVGDNVRVGVHSAKESAYLCNFVITTTTGTAEEQNFKNLVSSYSSINAKRPREDQFHNSLIAASFEVAPDTIRYLKQSELEKGHFYTKM